jgi:uncharacterized membrane protein
VVCSTSASKSKYQLLFVLFVLIPAAIYPQQNARCLVHIIVAIIKSVNSTKKKEQVKKLDQFSGKGMTIDGDPELSLWYLHAQTKGKLGCTTEIEG